MKKSHIITIIAVILMGLVSSVYQYIQVMKTEDVSAVTVGTPNPGHTWSTMQCSADSLCVDTANNRLGIGTNNPSQKLEVNGNGLFTGDVCNGAGACLSQIASFIGSQPLVNSVHTYAACTAAGGTVVASDVSYPQCRFNTATCPSGWSQYKSYSTTVGVTAGGTTQCWNGCSSPPVYQTCSTGTLTSGSHEFSSAGVEQATQLRPGPSGCGSCCTSSETWYSTVTQIGCY